MNLPWQLWKPGPVEMQVDGIAPLLASWEKSTHPAQVRLQCYLNDLACKLLPLSDDGPLYLHLDVDVEDPVRLLRHYDLENYLTPLFGSRCLPASKFSLVSARKYVGGGSRIAWGKAIPVTADTDDCWSHFSVNAGKNAAHKSWKERIRAGLAETGPKIIPPGPARVRLAWRCAARRNWVTFWKPTGDAMGPVLGIVNPDKPYHLNDDRIVDLELHRHVDDSLGDEVHVGTWWQSAADNDGDKNSMSLVEFVSDEQYQQWLTNNPRAFVVNTTKGASPNYMVLHRASCKHINEAMHEKTPGGFTEREYRKIGAAEVTELRAWVAAHGRPDGTFSNECSRCKPG